MHKETKDAIAQLHRQAAQLEISIGLLQTLAQQHHIAITRLIEHWENG